MKKIVEERFDREKIARAEAIRLFCKECIGFEVSLVNSCKLKSCPLWVYRKGRGKDASGDKKLDNLSRSEAVRELCIECMNGQNKLIKECADKACPLWPFRLGKGKEHTDAKLRHTKKEYES